MNRNAANLVEAPGSLTLKIVRFIIPLVLTGVPEGNEKAADGVLKGFLLQLKDLREQYPDRLSVKVSKSRRGKVL